MLNRIKKLIKHNESDIILVIGVVLIALISFGAGRLTAPETNQASIIFQDPSTSSGLSPSTSSGLSPSTSSGLSPSISSGLNAPASVIEVVTQKQGINEQIYKGKFVGSVNSDKYHWPNCQWAERIAVQNQIWFNSEAEAQKAGYKRCSQFEKNAP